MVKLQEDIIRNRVTEEELQLYYNNQLDEVLHSNYNIWKDLDKIPEIDIAANIIIEHIDKKLPIVLSSDIDADGISSCVIFYHILKNIFKVDKHFIKLVIGTRNQGRGVNRHVLNKLNKVKHKLGNNLSLVITADHGSTDEESYKILKEENPNIKIIVTDHHTVEYDNYPSSTDAFINTQREDCTYSKNICGCATLLLVFLRTYQLYFNKTNIKDFQEVLPTVATATIVDMMSMKDPINRYLVNLGMKYLNNNYYRNFEIFKKLLKLPNILTYRDMSMSIGPLVNTANRMSAEEITLLGFIIDDDSKAEEIFNYLATLNKIRKEETSFATHDALLDPDIYNYQYGNVVTISCKAMVTGPVAGNVGQSLQRPTICVASFPRDDFYIGSGRSGIEGLNLLQILRNIEQDHPGVIRQANGHKGACGITIYKNKLEVFKHLFNKYSKQAIDNFTIPEIKEEFVLDHKDINMFTYSKIQELGPYGLDFNQPIFLSKNIILKSLVRIKNFFKLNLVLEDGYNIDGMHFFRYPSKEGINVSNIRDRLKPGMSLNILYNLTTNYYNNKYSLQLEIVDILPNI